MTTYLVSRHRGAIEWIEQQGLNVDQIISHLEPETIQAGDIVIGTLPIQLAAQVCTRGARYLHLEIDLPFEKRGQELSAKDLVFYKAKLTEFTVKRSKNSSFSVQG